MAAFTRLFGRGKFATELSINVFLNTIMVFFNYVNTLLQGHRKG